MMGRNWLALAMMSGLMAGVWDPRAGPSATMYPPIKPESEMTAVEHDSLRLLRAQEKRRRRNEKRLRDRR